MIGDGLVDGDGKRTREGKLKFDRRINYIVAKYKQISNPQADVTNHVISVTREWQSTEILWTVTLL